MYKEQPFIAGDYAPQEQNDLNAVGEILNDVFDRQNCRTGATAPNSIVDMAIFNRTGGTSMNEIKMRDAKYNDESSTTMIEEHKLLFLVECAKNGVGAFLSNIYEGTKEMHLFHINAILDEIEKLEPEYRAIHWKNSLDSGVKYEKRYFLPNRLAYKVNAGYVERRGEDNSKVKPPIALDIDLNKKITKRFWNEQQKA